MAWSLVERRGGKTKGAQPRKGGPGPPAGPHKASPKKLPDKSNGHAGKPARDAARPKSAASSNSPGSAAYESKLLAWQIAINKQAAYGRALARGEEVKPTPARKPAKQETDDDDWSIPDPLPDYRTVVTGEDANLLSTTAAGALNRLAAVEKAALLGKTAGNGSTETPAKGSPPKGSAVTAAVQPPRGGISAKKQKCQVKMGWHYGAELREKVHTKSTEKASRDWNDILRSLCALGVVARGYRLPYALGRGDTENFARYRIALTPDDLDILHGRTVRHTLYRFCREFLLHYWCTLVCVAPWFLLQWYRDYDYLTTVYHAVTLNTPALHQTNHHGAVLLFCAIGGASFNYWCPEFCASWFAWKQPYMVVAMNTQIMAKTYSEVWNAQQEKTSVNTVASSPGVSRVLNECREVGKDMPPMMNTKFCLVAKFCLAAQALGICEEHDFNDDESPLEDEANKAVQGKDVERAQQMDLKINTFRLLDCRTVDLDLAKPTKLRSSVKVFTKSADALFMDRQCGRDVCIFDDDDKKRHISCIIGGPELIEIIASLSSSSENEGSGIFRHLRDLIHPVTGKHMDPDKISFDVQARLNAAAEMIGDHMLDKLMQNLAAVSHFKPPEKWSNDMRETVPELCEQARLQDKRGGRFRQRLLAGFNKTRELMLPLFKHARLVGTLGANCAMEDATSICPLENLMKLCYPHLITKGLSSDELDKEIEKLLHAMRKEGAIIESIDFSAMDSSWTFQDRLRLRAIAEKLLKPIENALLIKLGRYDPVIAASEHQQKIIWCLKYIKVLLDPGDAILFSGERMTSLFNRLLVLILAAAEMLRIHGAVNGSAKIKHMMEGTRKVNRGDGDDAVEALGKWNQGGDYDLLTRKPGGYRDQTDRICRYADMGKILEPCSGPNEMTDCEVLSRFHIWAGELKGYIHIGKCERNMGRLIAFKVDRNGLSTDTTSTQLSDKEIIMICTDIWQRVHTLKQTMVVRHFARAVFVHMLAKLQDKSSTTIYDDEDKRLGKVDGDRKMYECLTDIDEWIAGAVTSAYAMVKATNFRNFDKLSRTEVEQMQVDWTVADQIMSEVEITEKHMLYPASFIEDYPIPVSVCKALGFRQECLDAAPKRIREEVPLGVDVLELPAPGKLADVSDPTTAANTGCTRVDSASDASSTANAPANSDSPPNDARGLDNTGSTADGDEEVGAEAASRPATEAFGCGILADALGERIPGEEPDKTLGHSKSDSPSVLGEPASGNVVVTQSTAPSPAAPGEVNKQVAKSLALHFSAPRNAGVWYELCLLMTGAVPFLDGLTQSDSSDQAEPSTTSRDLLGVGNLQEVGAGSLRTNRPRKVVRRGIKREVNAEGTAAAMPKLEPVEVTDQQIPAPSGGPQGCGSTGLVSGSQGHAPSSSSIPLINDGESQSHGAQNPNRRNRRRAAANVSSSSPPQELSQLGDKPQQPREAKPAVSRTPEEWRAQRLKVRDAKRAAVVKRETEPQPELRADRAGKPQARPPRTYVPKIKGRESGKPPGTS